MIALALAGVAAGPAYGATGSGSTTTGGTGDSGGTSTPPTTMTTLSPGQTKVAGTFAPPTKPMGWGNVSHALALAQFALAQQGITSPTGDQLQAALIGGDITTADG